MSCMMRNILHAHNDVMHDLACLPILLSCMPMGEARIVMHAHTVVMASIVMYAHTVVMVSIVMHTHAVFLEMRAHACP